MEALNLKQTIVLWSSEGAIRDSWVKLSKKEQALVGTSSWLHGSQIQHWFSYYTSPGTTIKICYENNSEVWIDKVPILRSHKHRAGPRPYVTWCQIPRIGFTSSRDSCSWNGPHKNHTCVVKLQTLTSVECLEGRSQGSQVSGLACHPTIIKEGWPATLLS